MGFGPWSSRRAPGEFPESSRRVPAEFPGHGKVTPNFMKKSSQNHPFAWNSHHKKQEILPEHHEKAVPTRPEILTLGVAFTLDFMFWGHFFDAIFRFRRTVFVAL